jgi:hypothetical protein
MDWVDGRTLLFRGRNFSDEAELKKSIDRYSFACVTKLHLLNCALKCIPTWLSHALPKVAHLDLRYNSITEIPDYIVDFRNLERLHMENNPIAKISPNIGLLADRLEYFSFNRGYCSYGLDFERLCEDGTYSESKFTTKNYVLSVANFSLRRRNVCAAIYLVLLRFHIFMPRDVVKNILAPMLWESRYDSVWRCQNEKRETRSSSKKQKQK